MLEQFEHELETEDRRFGSGWISGTLGALMSLLVLGVVLCFRFPTLLTMPEARSLYPVPLIRSMLHVFLLLGFCLSALSLTLRRNKTLGTVGMVCSLTAALLGGSEAAPVAGPDSRLYFGLDWFFINLLFLGFVFIPLERIFRRVDQPVLRHEWREDLLYFFVGSWFVQGLTYCSLAPAQALLKDTHWGGLREWVASQNVVLQVLAIMLLTDFVQYWFHRTFHQVSRLWRFHAVHHSAEAMDWLAASRMHVVEIIAMRGITVIPMIVLGFSQPAMEAYLLYVYLLSSMIHANVKWDFGFLKYIIATPQFHHWHHGIEKEAIDVNFAIHFPFLDRIFGTYYMPDHVWPSGYGVGGHQVPSGYLKQFQYPFQSPPPKAAPAA